MFSFSRIITACTFIFLTGCGDSEAQVSNDISDLQKIIQFSTPVKTVKWEVFCWPCQGGFLPDQPALALLVAEFDPADPKWFVKTDELIKDIFIPPQSARPWISDSLKPILATESVDVSKFSCTSYRTKFTKSGKPVEGFVCEKSGRGLLYLVVDKYS